jgi:uncharacterized protein DUF6484
MRRKEAQVAHLNLPTAGNEDFARTTRIGRIYAIDEAGVVTVWIRGDQRPVQARLAVSATKEQFEHAIEVHQPVLLLIDEDAPQRPIIVGFVEEKLTPALAAPQIVEADVDGKRVRVVGQDEVVLECGSASITLRRNGRVIIKGTYVETHSDGTNRIKGGQVRIN